jgi:hypothetical protein
MATIVTKTSDQSSYLLEGGKLVVLGASTKINRMDTMSVDDDTFADLVTAFGAVIGA